jgi:hypothetical protein
MSASIQSLSTLLQPATLEDHTLPSKEINRLAAMVAEGSIKHLLLSGGNGRGKTLVARLISKSISPQNGIELNGASSGDRNFIVSGELTSYGSSTPLFGDHKLCFIDNADFLPKHAQGDCLLRLISARRQASFLQPINPRNYSQGCNPGYYQSALISLLKTSRKFGNALHRDAQPCSETSAFRTTRLI